MAIKLINPRRFTDDRGWFTETFVDRKWAALGVDVPLVQDNHSFSKDAGTIRGIHFQTPPHAQGKLVRCTRGRIMDYAVDLRVGSPTFGQHVAAELTAAQGNQLWVPVGFGHAFITLEPDCEVCYKVSDYYAPDCEGGIRWDCPDLGIDWPLAGATPGLSPKDAILPGLKDFVNPFHYTGEPMTLDVVG